MGLPKEMPLSTGSDEAEDWAMHPANAPDPSERRSCATREQPPSVSGTWSGL
jgi:hypothetical protein